MLLQQILKDLTSLTDPIALAALVKVLVIDLALAGENAVVVGTLVARLPQEQRRFAVVMGIAAALLLRLVFALLATQLLQVVGVVFAGGLLLLWVAWKMWEETGRKPVVIDAAGLRSADARGGGSMAKAVWSVAFADVSMSLDNVLGVAGAAKDHPGILIVGLGFSMALLGIAANLIASFIDRFRWITWIGIAVVLWVAGDMIWSGLMERDLGLLRRA